MPTSANTPDQRSDRYARYIQVGPTHATHLSRWVHPNGTTKSHPPPSIVKALTPSQLADTPSSPLPHNHAPRSIIWRCFADSPWTALSAVRPPDSHRWLRPLPGCKARTIAFANAYIRCLGGPWPVRADPSPITSAP